MKNQIEPIENEVRVQLLILSCDAFSDIWNANISLLKKNWPEAVDNSILVTETLPKVDIGIRAIASGDVGYSRKVATGLQAIDSEYVVVLLDDYLLTKRIDNGVINEIAFFAKRYSWDYVRVDRWKDEREKAEMDGFFKVDLSKHRYQVNMEPAVWKKESLQKILNDQKTAWELEVSMTKAAEQEGMIAVSTSKKKLPYLDTVRKGNILRKAWKFLKKNNLYHGTRKKAPFKQEARIAVMDIFKKMTPVWVQKKVKRYLVKKGHHYYSSWEQE